MCVCIQRVRLGFYLRSLVLDGVLLLSMFANNTDMVEITEVLVVVQCVSNNKGIWDGESNIVGDVSVRERGLLDQQRCNLNRLGGKLPQLGQQLNHGLSSVNDILNNQDVLLQQKQLKKCSQLVFVCCGIPVFA